MRLLRLLPLLLLSAAAPGAAAAPLQLTPCTPPGTTVEARCGTYEVFEDRAAGTGRKVPLAIVVLPATGERQPDPLVYFAGGPGEGATPAAPWLAHVFADLRKSRDIVLVDLRGTGQSAPLTCAEMAGARGVQGFLEDFLPLAAVRACRREHAARGLAHYNTAAAVDDVAEVLTALGYPRANLFGASYGTRSALEFAGRRPGQARTAVLLGVVPADARSPSTFARDAQAALDATIAECAADPVCGRAFPRTREEVAAVLDRLAAAPVTVELRHPRTGEPLSLRLSRAGFAQTLRYMLYVPTAAVMVPLYVHAAAEGNFRPLAELGVFLASAMGTGLADGFFLSVTCAEDVPFIDDAAAAAAARGTFIGDFRVRAQQAACREWGVPPLSREALAPVRSEVPALLISGERDPVTPARWGEEVARHLPRARHLVIADGAHGLEGMKGSECVDGLMTRFVEQGTAEGLDTGCLAGVERPPFATELAAAEVTVEPARLARLAGTYAAPEGGLEAQVAVADGRLRVSFGAEETFFLVAESPARFRIEGLPAGYYIEFDETEGEVTALRLVEGSQTMILARCD